ncbi:MAG: Ig-like domain-containing protein [Marinilabiliaceae bacterium]
MKQKRFSAVLFMCIAGSILFSANGNHGTKESRPGPYIKQNINANDDFISMFENRVWHISVLNNDYGVGDQISEFEIIEHPENGNAEITSKNTIKYAPNERFTGEDQLQYRVCNGSGSCDQATVFIEVKDYDFTPRAKNDTARVDIDSTAIIDVLENDQNIYDHPLELHIISDLNNGHSEVTDDLLLKLDFTSYFVNPDSLVYEVCDAENDCDQATLTIDPITDDSEEPFIPEGFSPNGDGFNDTFHAPDLDIYQHLKLKVLDRNGVLVYEESDYDNDWDGKANRGPWKGKNLPKGNYYYIITFSEKTIKGSVFLTR